MATIVLGAVGASLGSGFGGTLLGLSGAVVGRAVGATVGRVIDQRLLGGGTKPVETGRIDRLRLQTAGEGQPLTRLWGQVRVSGHVIWAAPLVEVRRDADTGGGKGAPKGPQMTELSYELTCAIALAEGPVSGIGRIWADGEEVDPEDLPLRFYPGHETQLPDAAIAAHLGDEAPAYRGVAYVVIDGLNLERWGNRLPQLSFEVSRRVEGGTSLAERVRAVQMIPGTGEYSLATTEVTVNLGLGEHKSLNRNAFGGGTDVLVSLRQLARDLPNCESVSVVVSWFGDDLRCGMCTLRPKVESRHVDPPAMPWRSGGITRAQALTIPQNERGPIYGGTPCDQSVIEALRAIVASGRRAVVYPFILMDQLAGNGLPDPHGGAEQPAMPWRGRITASLAPGQTGSPDGRPTVAAEVAAFFGTARPQHFTRSGGRVSYSGPDEWSYRRMILHMAHLAAEAGGVDAFVIGSELVELTRLRVGPNDYPAVAALQALAADCRAILGPDVKLTYAADWTEYFGDVRGSERRFHLDPLWADPNIDAVAIDNYLPLSDWREGETHRDAAIARSGYDAAYLRANIEGGELYDWYYASAADRVAQVRSPITDGLADEPWIWRIKDVRNWWANAHHERDATGARSPTPTAWEARSKPVWFTEIGCAAIDKGTNEPNKFIDAQSSESGLPVFSDGRRDDAIQSAYVDAMMGYWAEPGRNPIGTYGGPMLDLSRTFVWCWDARPYPAFPARTDLWSDGASWERGHWLNGRASAVPLADVVTDLCRQSGLPEDLIDVSGLHGQVRGFLASGGETARANLQVLMLAYGLDVIEGEGKLSFRVRTGRLDARLSGDAVAVTSETERPELMRAPEAEIAGRVRLTHVEAGADYAAATAEAILPDERNGMSSDSELPLVLLRSEGRAVADRWLAEARVARDSMRFALPPSTAASLGVGDVIALDPEGGHGGRWRIDRIERAGAATIEAVRVEPALYRAARPEEALPRARRFVPVMPVWSEILDLPLLSGSEVRHAPRIAATATPWPGPVAVWSAPDEAGGWELAGVLPTSSVMGVTLDPLPAARPGLLDRGAPVRLRLRGGTLAAVSLTALQSGANALAIGDGTPDRWEVLQFQDATLVGPDVWQIARRLRGQAGTDAVMPEVWPEGSLVVLLDGRVPQLDIPPSWRAVQRRWRVGAAARGPADPAVNERRQAVAGVGLRPLSPVHLKLAGRTLTWVRRTRIDGDGWEGVDVPLGEAAERYRVRLMRGTEVLAEALVDSAAWTIPDGAWDAARAGGAFDAEVAQFSDAWGAGPATRRTIHA